MAAKERRVKLRMVKTWAQLREIWNKSAFRVNSIGLLDRPRDPPRTGRLASREVAQERSVELPGVQLSMVVSASASVPRAMRRKS